jgi:hypothetical protein
VERLRGLEFDRHPRIAVMGEDRLAAVGRRLARHERHTARLHPARLQADHRLERASFELDQLAGLLPPESSLGPDVRATGLERIGGAFDFPRNRIIIVPTAIATRTQLYDTLAHELTHALESERFSLQLRELSRPGEAPSVHRALIEGTAMFVQDRYQRRYLGDDVSLHDRIEGLRSLIAATPGAYAINAQAIFDYVDGALFVDSLYRRTGDWSLVNRALQNPPRRSQEILHPDTWPGAGQVAPIQLGVRRTLRDRWRRVGGGSAGEEQALVILLAGALDSIARIGASGWNGGRFAVWAPRSPRSNCAPECVMHDVGVVAFRWRHRDDAKQFELAVPAYTNLGLFAEFVTHRIWKRGDGYIALGTADRASALAFAPSRHLADLLSRRSAKHAAAYDVHGEQQARARLGQREDRQYSVNSTGGN